MPTIGDPAPDFSGNDFVNGGTFTLSDHSGKVILLCFVSRGCPYCDAEIPCMQSLWSKVSGHGVQVVAVHLGWWGYTEADAATWMAGHGVTFPAVHEDSPYPIYNSYIESPGVPHIYVIGRDMVIRKDILGGIPCDVLEGHVMDVVYMRDPIDIEMVMDVSDSMNSPSPSDPGGDPKLAMMKQASTMILDFLNDHGQVDDRMGLVWFTDDVSEHQNPAGQKLLPVRANWADLRSQISVHGTGTCTAMGAGLQKAFDTLSSSTQKRFTILCTDGMQNIEPKVAEVGGHYEIIDSGGWICDGHSSVPPHPGVNITSYNARVHPIGVGITANYATLLQGVANETNGFYRGTNDPENDLDLIYFLDLCNCMSSGSPAVIHHNTGRFMPEECEAVEVFCLNRSVRKMTAMLSWKEAQGGNLTFWLCSPDGTLLDLHQEMKLYENHCMATVYLPRQHGGVELDHVGQWSMIIRGETGGSCVDYHAFVIGEDRETKYRLDYPRKIYEVGDILPIKLSLTDSKKALIEPREVLMETARPRAPLSELLAEYKASSYELLRKAKARTYEAPKDPAILKMEAMASEPRFMELLKPSRRLLSLRKGEFACKIEEREVLVPVVLERPGLHSFKIEAQCETPEGGPIHRTDMVSVVVGPGRADPELTKVTTVEVSTEKQRGVIVNVTPRNVRGQLLGPGLGHELKAMVGGKGVEVEVEDRLDGTYRVEIMQPKKKEMPPIDIAFQGKTVWKGKFKEGNTRRK